MAKVNKPKYFIGDTVQDKTDKSEYGEVIGFSTLKEGTKITYLYQIQSKEVDIPNKKILEGVKTFREDEIQSYKAKENE